MRSWQGQRLNYYQNLDRIKQHIFTTLRMWLRQMKDPILEMIKNTNEGQLVSWWWPEPKLELRHNMSGIRFKWVDMNQISGKHRRSSTEHHTQFLPASFCLRVTMAVGGCTENSSEQHFRAMSLAYYFRITKSPWILCDVSVCVRHLWPRHHWPVLIWSTRTLHKLKLNIYILPLTFGPDRRLQLLGYK